MAPEADDFSILRSSRPFTTRATTRPFLIDLTCSRLPANLFGACNWIQIPNSYDQLAQDQRQRVLTWNIAPGYQHVFNAHYLLTVNPYIRKDDFNYYPSRNFLNDTPSTQAQHRKLLNYGVRSDVSINEGRHNVKIGIDFKQTRLFE